MKKLSRKFKTAGNIVIASLFLVSLASASFASSMNKDDEKEDKVTMKMRESVSKASPDDWYTLAMAAEKCIKKGVNLTEASEWLDKSLSIKETSYNLTVKGDYYKANRLPDKALEYYVKAIRAGKAEDATFNSAEIQEKIAVVHFKR